MNPLFSTLLQQGGGQLGTRPGQGQGPLPGQQAFDMSGLLEAMGQPQPQSGAIGIPQQQAQSGMVLPPKPGGQEFGTMGAPPSLDAALGGMQDPSTMNVNPATQSMPINGAVQQQQVSQQGGATGVPNTASAPKAIDPATGQPFAQTQPSFWDLLNPMNGTRDAPNALVRAGEGYNSGGLIGALGYLLTDMSKQANGTTNQGS